MSNPQTPPSPGSSFVAQFGHLLSETVSQELITQWVTDTAQAATMEPDDFPRKHAGRFYRAFLMRRYDRHCPGQKMRILQELIYQVGRLTEQEKGPDKRLVGPIFCETDGEVYLKRKEITARYHVHNGAISTALRTGKPTGKAGLVLRPATEEEINQNALAACKY